MPQFRSKYVYEKMFGNPHHTWIVIGAKGAVHLHISGPHRYKSSVSGEDEEHYSAGLEFHHRSPPSHMADQAPSHDRCWVLECPCWHDGTSLYAKEELLPLWLLDPNGHDNMLRQLEREYVKRFERTCE